MPYLISNNIQMYYEEYGSGQPIVFIHGLGASTRDWERQAHYFSKTYRVITFDLRGHGRTDKPDGPYDIPMFVKDIVELLETLHIKTAHIVGWSLGGVVTFQLALDFPERVRTMTIINSTPTFGDPVLFQREIDRRVNIVRQFGMRAISVNLAELLFPKSEDVRLREQFIERWAENDTSAYIEATRSGLGWSVIDRLGEIKCPTLVVSAEHDYWPVTDQAAWAKLIPNVQFKMIPDSHHAVVLESPEILNRMIKAFLAENA